MLTLAQLENYARQHVACPACGSEDVTASNNAELFNDIDRNPAKCECGWVGVVDDLAPHYGDEVLDDRYGLVPAEKTGWTYQWMGREFKASDLKPAEPEGIEIFIPSMVVPPLGEGKIQYEAGS